MGKEIYETPFASRYSSSYMKELFSATTRAVTWRKLWLALAKSEKKCGLAISEEQIKDLEAHLTDIDFDVISEKEKEVKHDVMAHIYAYGQKAPLAKPVIHLGATSCYVTDNADLILYRDALLYIRKELVLVINNLYRFADQHKATPILGFTHYQPAQLVTVGKRASLWLLSFINDLKDLDYVISSLKFLGCRGTTGTEASFLDLFNGDEAKIDEMNHYIADEFGFRECFEVAGQTYPRIEDTRILNVLGLIAETSYKFAVDMRLLEHDHYLEEPFGDNQVGSSAMAYKRNPVLCERVCSLSRYMMTNRLNASFTSADQWLERTLDDSAIRRITMPESFLDTDAILKLVYKISGGIVVNEKVIEKSVNDYLPFIATENMMMEAVKHGYDRQDVHKIIRDCSMEATRRMKNGESCDLIELLLEHEEFHNMEKELKEVLKAEKYIGRCVSQTKALLDKYRHVISDLPDLDMKVDI